MILDDLGCYCRRSDHLIGGGRKYLAQGPVDLKVLDLDSGETKWLFRTGSWPSIAKAELMGAGTLLRLLSIIVLISPRLTVQLPMSLRLMSQVDCSGSIRIGVKQGLWQLSRLGV